MSATASYLNYFMIVTNTIRRLSYSLKKVPIRVRLMLGFLYPFCFSVNIFALTILHNSITILIVSFRLFPYNLKAFRITLPIKEYLYMTLFRVIINLDTWQSNTTLSTTFKGVFFILIDSDNIRMSRHYEIPIENLYHLIDQGFVLLNWCLMLNHGWNFYSFGNYIGHS